MSKRPRVGDVIEIDTGQGLAYAQLSHFHDDFGSLIRVLPGVHPARPESLDGLVDQPETFFTFYPVGAALRKGLVEVVGSAEVPGRVRDFPLMRMASERLPDGTARSWLLWDGTRIVGRARAEHRGLSIADGWNHELLVHRILEGWRPEHDSERAPSLLGRVKGLLAPARLARRPPETAADAASLLASQHPGEPVALDFYLYFDQPEAARAAAADLREDGFEVEVRPSAEGDQTLALVRLTDGGAADEADRRMGVVAARHGGEYDGWEAAAGTAPPS